MSGKKFRHPAGVAIRQGLDATRYRRSAEGRGESQARRAHNDRFYPNQDKKTKRHLKRMRKQSDAKKGEFMRNYDISYMPGEATRNAIEQVRRRRNLPTGAVMRARGGTFKGMF